MTNNMQPLNNSINLNLALDNANKLSGSRNYNAKSIGGAGALMTAGSNDLGKFLS